MKLRYKIYEQYRSFEGKLYYVKIQKYTGNRIFKWHTVCDNNLPYVLYKINHNAFTDYTYLAFVPSTEIYEELTKYNSIEEIVMKYINNVVLKKEKKERDEDVSYDLIGKFVLTDGWKTIEVKESEN